MNQSDQATDALLVESLHAGQLWRVHLNRPPGNILDAELTVELTALFERASQARGLKLITLEGQGEHFSYGASIEEHMPELCAAMLDRFHRMLFALLDSHTLVHAVVRGQCLGGGLELATLCQRVYCTLDARLGQPEIVLGVIAPVASVVLPGRLGRGPAEDLCSSGRILDGQEALRIGLVDELAEDPWQACEQSFESHLKPRSASSLRLAVQALRLQFARDFKLRIREVERLYLDRLMKTHDAVEGLLAFTEKRSPSWLDQ